MGRAAFISVVLVAVDIGFTWGGLGLAGGCGGGTVVEGGARGNGLAIGMTGGTMVTRGITGGKGFVTEMLDWKVKGGRGVMHLDGEGRDTGLTVY